MGFLSELQKIFWDIFFTYKNVFHFVLSKIVIFLWTMLAGFMATVPFLCIAIFIGVIDPIDWGPVIGYALGGSPVSLEMVTGITENIIYIIAIAVFIVLAGISFFITSGYSILLISRLAYRYSNRDVSSVLSVAKTFFLFILMLFLPLSLLFQSTVAILALLVWLGIAYMYFKKREIFQSFFLRDIDILFSKIYFISYLKIVLQYSKILSLGLLICLGIFSLFYTLNVTGIISFTIFSYILLFFAVIGVVGSIYIFFRVIFAVVILAMSSEEDIYKTGKQFVQESIATTKGFKSLTLWVIVVLIYLMCMYPITGFVTDISNTKNELEAAFASKTGYAEVMIESQPEYYEYLVSQYGGISQDKLYEDLSYYARLDAIVSILSYLLFSGIFIMIVTFFYIRVIEKNRGKY